MKEINVGIIGYGILGKTIKSSFWISGKIKKNFLINDPKIEGSISLEKISNKSNYIFICLPTPYNEKIGCNYSDILWILNKISNTKATIVIKSTVPPDFVDKLSYLENSIYEKLIIEPEFSVEKSFYFDYVNKKFSFIGCKNKKLFFKYKQFLRECSRINPYDIKFEEVSLKQACLLKYIINSYLGMKLIFLNQFKNILDSFNEKNIYSDWNEFIKLAHFDDRLGKDYNKIPGIDGDIGFGGKCLPKDIMSIVRDYPKLTLLKEVLNINEEIRTNKDWLKIEGAIE